MSGQACLAESIQLGVLTSAPIQKQVYLKYAEKFNRENPNVNLELLFRADAEYKADFAKWIKQGEGPQILAWQGGNRLNRLIKKDQIVDLSNFYAKHNLLSTFNPSALGVVSYESKHYAVPISYYQWGFYYRKSVFDELGLLPPATWQQFLNVAQTLKENDIVPITIGLKNKWPVGAWFDYLNLRMNGLAFHKQLLQGEHRFTDPRVISVFKEWKALIDADYFLNERNIWTWQEAMPYLYHKKAGMTLTGNFFSGSMPLALKDDFKFFRFPIIHSDKPVYEEAPLDLLMVPHYTKMTSNIEKVLLMFAGVEFQQEFNEVSGMISPNSNVRENPNYFIKQGRATLEQAIEVSQFFDRDTNEAFAGTALQILTEFIDTANIEMTVEALESARIEYLK